MQFFEAVKSSESGRAEMLAGETEIFLCDGVGIYEREIKTEHQAGTAQLTSFRILYLSRTHKLGLPLGQVLSVESTLGFMSISHPKVIIRLPGKDLFIKLSFRQGGIDVFFPRLQRALEAKAWASHLPTSLPITSATASPTPLATASQQSYQHPSIAAVSSSSSSSSSLPSSPSSSLSSGHGVGVGGIVRREEQRLKDTDETLQEAFTDLKALMENAKELVVLAERFGRKVASENNNAEDKQYQELLLDMGIPNPVTKKTAGTAFHRELAKQLCDFLLQHIGKTDGVIALPDAYCLFNRARGTALISPDDMMTACQMFPSLQLPLVVKSFPSGVVLIVSADHSEARSAKQIGEFALRKLSVTVFDVAEEYGVSIALAKEMILNAERQAAIVPDVTAEGSRYFPNYFPAFELLPPTS